MPLPKKISVSSVRKWASELPYANKPLIAEETHQLMERIAESSLSVKDRVAILEFVRAPADEVFLYIRSRLATGFRPSADILHFGERFSERFSDISSALVNEIRRGRMMFGGKAVRDRARVLANHFLLQWQLLRALDRRAAPASLWERMLTANFGDHSGTCVLWPRMVALYLADPRSLSAKQLIQVISLLEQLPLQDLVRLGDPGGEPGVEGFYLRGRNATLEYGPTPEGAIPVDLSGLTARLQYAHPFEVDPELLHHLLARWSGERVEREPRVQLSQPIQIRAFIGLHSIARNLASDTAIGIHLESGAVGAAFATDTGAISDTDFSREAEIRDASDGGCRLLIDVERMQTGELIAIESGNGHWRAGTIAWSVRRDGRTECGVEWQLDDPIGVSASFQSEADAIPVIRGRSCRDGRTGLLYYGRMLPDTADSCRLRAGRKWLRHSLETVKRTELAELAIASPAKNAGRDAARLFNDSRYEVDNGWASLAALGATT